MKERLKAIAPKVGFPLFYLFCLVIFARWTFPYEKLRDRIVMAFNQQQRDTGGQQELKIEEIGPSWLSGISAKGIRLIGAPSEPGKPPSEIKVDEASGSISLFGLMFGDHDLSLRVSAFGGTIKGSFDDSPKERKIDVTVEGVDLGQIPMFTDALGVPVEGTLDGTVKLSLPDQKASSATGRRSSRGCLRYRGCSSDRSPSPVTRRTAFSRSRRLPQGGRTSSSRARGASRSASSSSIR